ncbi:MAG: LptE family protein [Bacteroidales bacterium]|nr:LptE family protein [Bacteroidales bacterium]HOK99893.1 LptE family protein [Bacteroidales bacterium]HPO66246.1 LptE family protein [Bacteroidales bacterium]
MTWIKKLLFPYWILIFLVFLSSCFSVHYSTTGASISPDVKTCTVRYFQNRAPNASPYLAQQLTDKLREKIQNSTRLTMLSDGGDVYFEGEITGYEVTPQAVQGNDKAAQNRLTVTVRVRFVNNVEPKYNYDANFSRYQDFPSSQMLNQVEQELVKTIFEEITEDIFNKAFANW